MQSFFEILNAPDVDTDHPYFRRLRPQLEALDERSRAPLGPRPVVTREFLPGVTVTAPDGYSCDANIGEGGAGLRQSASSVSCRAQEMGRVGAAVCRSERPADAGTGGNLARDWQERGYEELRRLMDQRLAAAALSSGKPGPPRCFEAMDTSRRKSSGRIRCSAASKCTSPRWPCTIAASTNTCSGSLGQRGSIRRRYGQPWRWSSRKANGLASSFRKNPSITRGCESSNMSLLTLVPAGNRGGTNRVTSLLSRVGQRAHAPVP